MIVTIRRNPVEALNPAMKASNLLNNALATREAYAKGAFEAILLNTRGEVAEGLLGGFGELTLCRDVLRERKRPPGRRRWLCR